MTIQDICSQLLQQSERVRIGAKGLRADLSILFALHEYDGPQERDMEIYRHKLADAAVHLVVLESAQDELKAVTTEAERVIEQLQDKQDKPTKTRPIPFVQLTGVRE